MKSTLINQNMQGIITLIQSQEPLGHEFSKVLYNNLWNLYVS